MTETTAAEAACDSPSGTDAVLPGATRDALDELFGLPSRSARMPAMRQLARRVASELVGRDAGAHA